MKRFFIIGIFAMGGCNLMAQDLFTQSQLLDNFPLHDTKSSQAKSNDFGLSMNFDVERKLARGLSWNFEGEFRTQDNTSKVSRWMLGTSISYRLYQNIDKTFNIKAELGWQYLWLNNLEQTSSFSRMAEHVNKDEAFDGYTFREGTKHQSSYWRNRHRTMLSLTANYSPTRRWTFQLKETFQFSHYCSTDSIPRTRFNTTYYKFREANGYDDGEGNPVYYDANNWQQNSDDDFYENPDKKETPFTDIDNNDPKRSKNKWVLRSKLTVKYDVRGLPLDPYASIEYGCGLNYTTNKFKYAIGAEYKLSKQHKLDLFYRFTHEDDDDEPNGHLIGVGYKFEF